MFQINFVFYYLTIKFFQINLIVLQIFSIKVCSDISFYNSIISRHFLFNIYHL